jgi:hypothetical protein
MEQTRVEVAAAPAIEVGKVYQVNSQRKGKFMMRVTDVNDKFITGVITNGKAGAMLSYNEREQGEEVTVRQSLCSFTLADAALASAGVQA